MKRTKIESKMVKIFKAKLPKQFRKDFKQNSNRMCFAIGINDSHYTAGTEELVFSPNDAREVFTKIGETFKISGIELAESLSRPFNITQLSNIIKEKMDEPEPFEYEDVKGDFCFLRTGIVQIDQEFNTNSDFWQAFDEWYKNNRKKLFTKPKKVKLIKQAKPEKLKKEPKPKKEKKNKATEAAAPVLQ